MYALKKIVLLLVFAGIGSCSFAMEREKPNKGPLSEMITECNLRGEFLNTIINQLREIDREIFELSNSKKTLNLKTKNALLREKILIYREVIYFVENSGPNENYKIGPCRRTVILHTEQVTISIGLPPKKMDLIIKRSAERTNLKKTFKENQRFLPKMNNKEKIKLREIFKKELVRTCDEYHDFFKTEGEKFKKELVSFSLNESGVVNFCSRDSENVRKCGFCGIRKENLKICSQCKTAFYCSRDCQKNHWKYHKTVCRKKK